MFLRLHAVACCAKPYDQAHRGFVWWDLGELAGQLFGMRPRRKVPSANPGQVLAYKIGALKIGASRGRARTALGESGSLQLLAQHPPQRGDRERFVLRPTLLRCSEHLAQQCIDERLIADALALRLRAKVFDHVIVEHDRDASVAGRRHHRSTLALAEVVLVTHGIAPLRHDWPCEQ
jgi:hypothetical protein